MTEKRSTWSPGCPLSDDGEKHRPEIMTTEVSPYGVVAVYIECRECGAEAMIEVDEDELNWHCVPSMGCQVDFPVCHICESEAEVECEHVENCKRGE